MTAMIATLDSVNDQNWYSDAEATNHCTSDVNNLMYKEDYLGSE